MSGPDYPRPSYPTRTDGLPELDPYAPIISQYANSDILTGIILTAHQCIDQSKNIDDFYRLVMDLSTAEGYGLDVWARIVGVNRVLQVDAGVWFGFEEALPNSVGFNQEGFYSGSPTTSNYALSDQAFRLLILAKAAANITDGSIPSINRILMSLFPGRGNAYVTEGFQGDPYFGFQEALNTSGFNQNSFYAGTPIPTMVMTFTFEFALTPVELAIVQNSGVLPKSTGVAATVVINP